MDDKRLVPSHEDDVINAITVAHLLDKLNAEDKELILAWMLEEVKASAHPFRMKVIIHTLATYAGAEWYCKHCQSRKGASAFTLQSRTTCRSCLIERARSLKAQREAA